MNSNTKNILLLVVRLIAGGLITYYGYMKLTDMAGTVALFESKFGLSETITWMVVVGELLAGLGLIFGVWTKVSAVGAIIIMLGVFYYTKAYDHEPAIILIGSIILLITGGGRYALCGGKCCKDDTCSVKPNTTPSPAQPSSSVPPSHTNYPPQM